MRLNFVAPINDRSYGICGLNILKALLEANVQVAWFPLGGIQAEQHYGPLLNQGMSNAKFFDSDAPSIRLFHQFSLAEHVSKTCRIGWPIFELNEFTPTETHHLKQQDRLFVCSEWAKQVISSVGKPVDVIPLGVDREIFNEYIQPAEALTDTTRFFHCSKYEKRKGHDVLCDVFNKAFDIQDNVELWISWHNPFMKPEAMLSVEREYKLSRLGSKIRFINWVHSHRDMAKYMASTDAGIWLSRAEGWLLPALEYMSLGKPLIAMNVSGPTEYLDNENALLIEATDSEPAFDDIWFHGKTGEWATIGDYQIEQAVCHMRDIHRSKQGGVLFNKYGIETAKRFSWTNTAGKIVEALNAGRFQKNEFERILQDSRASHL